MFKLLNLNTFLFKIYYFIKHFFLSLNQIPKSRRFIRTKLKYRIHDLFVLYCANIQPIFNFKESHVFILCFRNHKLHISWNSKHSFPTFTVQVHIEHFNPSSINWTCILKSILKLLLIKFDLTVTWRELGILDVHSDRGISNTPYQFSIWSHVDIEKLPLKNSICALE